MPSDIIDLTGRSYGSVRELNGRRYTLDGVHVAYCCLMGHHLHIGRPWAVGQTLEDVEVRPCPICFPYTRQD